MIYEIKSFCFCYFRSRERKTDSIFSPNKKVECNNKYQSTKYRAWECAFYDLLKSRIGIYWRKKSRNLSCVFLYFFIFIFSSMTYRLTDKVNYNLDAYWYRNLHQKNQPFILIWHTENH